MCPQTTVDLCETWSSDDGQSPADEAGQIQRDRMRKHRGGHRAWQYCKLIDVDLRALEVIELSPIKG